MRRLAATLALLATSSLVACDDDPSKRTQIVVAVVSDLAIPG
jgi:hypothetical protein